MRAWLVVLVLLAPAARAARITDVADAGDEKHPLEVDLDATYRHERTTTTLTRETVTPGGIQLQDDLKHVRTLDAVDLRLGVGLWHDLELHVLAPVALRDTQEWSGNSSLTTNTISVSGCANTSACGTVQPIAPVPGQSDRVGFFDPTIGVAWGPVNEDREAKLQPFLFPDGKPVATWVLGLDWTLPLPGGKVNDPSRWGMASALGGARPTAGSESRKAHVVTGWTAFSKRFRVLEPFAAMSVSVPFAASGAYDDCAHPELLADVAAANCAGPWKGQTSYKPPVEAQLTFGTELVAMDDRKADQRFSFELRGDLRWHGPARDYTQVADALGKLTYADEYVTSTVTAGVYARFARWLHAHLSAMAAMDSAHFLTHEDIGDDKNGDGKITISGGSGVAAPDQNPLYDFRLDQVGRRLRAEPSFTFGLAGSLSLNF